MLNHRIQRADWGAVFCRLTAKHADVPGQATARLQVSRPDGDASRADLADDRAWLPFVGIAWEPDQETISVALDGLVHRIKDPLDVWTDNGPEGPISQLLVRGVHGHRDEVTFEMEGLHW